MHVERINNPDSVTADEIEAILAQGRMPIVQFSRPGYSPELLRSLNDLCLTFGPEFGIRFYGHYGGGFDAAVLSDIPDVRRLYVDCLMRIHNEEQLWQLSSLEQFSFGVYELDRSDFLDGFQLERLKHLCLSETRKRNIDLTPLGRCAQLGDLIVVGHTKGLEALGGLPKVRTLSLNQIPRAQSLSFVNTMPALRSLTILLGGRTDLDEVSHPDLEELSVVRVRGLETLGELGRFPSLRRLQVEDQLQLRSFSLAGLRLHELLVLNCKNLAEIEGFEGQDALAHFRASRTRLDLDSLLKRDWPPAMEVLALYSGSQKWNKAARQELDRRGFREYGSGRS